MSQFDFFSYFCRSVFQLETECKDTESFANKTNKNAENFTTMNDRLKQVIDYYNITPYAFSQKIGVSEGTVRKILSQNTTIRSDNLVKISQTFTDIDLHWLITGQGHMFLSEREHIKQEAPTNDPSALQMIADLARENGQLQAENAELKKELARAETRMAASAKTAAG